MKTQLQIYHSHPLFCLRLRSTGSLGYEPSCLCLQLSLAYVTPCSSARFCLYQCLVFLNSYVSCFSQLLPMINIYIRWYSRAASYSSSQKRSAQLWPIFQHMGSFCRNLWWSYAVSQGQRWHKALQKKILYLWRRASLRVRFPRNLSGMGMSFPSWYFD